VEDLEGSVEDPVTRTRNHDHALVHVERMIVAEIDALGTARTAPGIVAHVIEGMIARIAPGIVAHEIERMIARTARGLAAAETGAQGIARTAQGHDEEGDPGIVDHVVEEGDRRIVLATGRTANDLVLETANDLVLGTRKTKTSLETDPKIVSDLVLVTRRTIANARETERMTRMTARDHAVTGGREAVAKMTKQRMAKTRTKRMTGTKVR